MVYPVFNKFVLDTLIYKEITRILDEGMKLGRKTLHNWLEKALRYLNSFRTQLFVCIYVGSYTVSYFIVEHFINPLACERRNSLLFKSGKIADVTASYHTIKSTCKMQGASALQYLKEFFKQILPSHIDYENLLPLPIGIIKIKKYPIFNKYNEGTG